MQLLLNSIVQLSHLDVTSKPHHLLIDDEDDCSECEEILEELEKIDGEADLFGKFVYPR